MEASKTVEEIVGEMLERNDRRAHEIMNRIANLAMNGVVLEDE